MKTPVIIWQKPEYKKFGRVRVAALVSPTLIIIPNKTPEIKNFDHHNWVIPKNVNPFGYKAIKITQLPATAAIDNEGQIDNAVLERYRDWVDRFVQNAPSGKECLLISNDSHDYAALIPKTKKLTILNLRMECSFRWVTQPLINKNERIEESGDITMIETSTNLWNIPVGTDANDFWTPILCTKQGLGFDFPVRRKGVFGKLLHDSANGVDYHQMTEQEAWRFVNDQLLAKSEVSNTLF